MFTQPVGNTRIFRPACCQCQPCAAASHRCYKPTPCTDSDDRLAADWMNQKVIMIVDCELVITKTDLFLDMPMAWQYNAHYLKLVIIVSDKDCCFLMNNHE